MVSVVGDTGMITASGDEIGTSCGHETRDAGAPDEQQDWTSAGWNPRGSVEKGVDLESATGREGRSGGGAAQQQSHKQGKCNPVTRAQTPPGYKPHKRTNYTRPQATKGRKVHKGTRRKGAGHIKAQPTQGRPSNGRKPKGTPRNEGTRTKGGLGVGSGRRTMPP